MQAIGNVNAVRVPGSNDQLLGRATTPAILLAGLGFVFPRLMLGNQMFVLGLFILTFALVTWGSAYSRLIRLPFLQERVYVLMDGKRAKWLVETIRRHPELGTVGPGQPETGR